jgi:CubicO group peptidase (beta-lactamase class C family)
MKKLFVIIIMFTGLISGSIYSQKFNKPKLDSLFDILAQKNKAMGSLTLSKDGKVVYSRAIGYSFISDAEKNPASETTKYRIGSITKMFTAVIILQLSEEGKISLDATLDKYFPALPNASKITIRNLLNHRSGLHNFTSEPEYMTYMTSPKTHDEMLTIISKYPVDFQPNEKYSYSNSNYVLLGYIIEKICNEPYSKVLKSRITDKLGLTNTYLGGKTDIKNNESYSYRWVKNWEQQPETDMSIPGAAGAIVSTPTDLTKFIEAIFSLKLVSGNSLDQMKNMIDGYGMAMIKAPFNAKTGYGHGGGIDGFGSNLIYFPEDNLAIAYCTNGQVYPGNDILIGALSIYNNMEYSIPDFIPKPAIALKTEELDKYLGEYSSTQIPLKIIFTKDNSTLFAQATGQSAFPLEATEKDKFRFEQAGIEIEFNTDKGEFTLKQGGGSFLFTKAK